MKVLEVVFMVLAISSTIGFLYCIVLMTLFEYTKYLHDVAFYSLLGAIIGCVFGALSSDSQVTSKQSEERHE